MTHGRRFGGQVHINFLRACVSDVWETGYGVWLRRELTDSLTVPQGSLPNGMEVRTPSPVLSQRSITENLPPSAACVTQTSEKPSMALQLYTTQTAIRDSLPHITSIVSTFSNQIPNTPWMSLCHSLQSKRGIIALFDMAHQR